MRGEKLGIASYDARRAGSPPLARGKEIFLRNCLLKHRITPACAGKSIFEQCSSQFHWDHPRLRGEKSGKQKASSGLLGSPPLARGKVFTCIIASRLYGITPACAGKRLKGFHKYQLFTPEPLIFHLICDRSQKPNGNRSPPYAFAPSRSQVRLQ